MSLNIVSSELIKVAAALVCGAMMLSTPVMADDSTNGVMGTGWAQSAQANQVNDRINLDIDRTPQASRNPLKNIPTNYGPGYVAQLTPQQTAALTGYLGTWASKLGEKLQHQFNSNSTQIKVGSYQVAGTALQDNGRHTATVHMYRTDSSTDVIRLSVDINQYYEIVQTNRQDYGNPMAVYNVTNHRY